MSRGGVPVDPRPLRGGVRGGFQFSRIKGEEGFPIPASWIPAPYRGTGRAFAGITMALRRPHMRIKMVVRRAVLSIVW